MNKQRVKLPLHFTHLNEILTIRALMHSFKAQFASEICQ